VVAVSATAGVPGSAPEQPAPVKPQ
jgi:hypothetical protein